MELIYPVTAASAADRLAYSQAVVGALMDTYASRAGDKSPEAFGG